MDKSRLNVYLINSLVLVSLALGFYYFVKVKDWYLGVILTLITPPALLSPRYLYRKKWREKYNLSLWKTLDFFAATFFVLVVTGSLSDWSFAFKEYDNLVHFVDSVLIAIIIAFLITSFRKQPLQPPYFKFALTVFLLTVSLGFFWEFFEFSNDQLFGTRLLFDRFQPSALDTFWDLVYGTAGSFLGSILVFFNWSKWQNKWLIKTSQKTQP